MAGTTINLLYLPQAGITSVYANPPTISLVGVRFTSLT